ncbi:DUF2958 domain-containing protein [Microvirga sp. SRT01]|uniref:DUF2958 domain-containing protein n=1 Tax=Sphingomonas longa TaxID=2778730 RepID=A0ABS2DAN4_9SPHN|nr:MULTISPECIES: DUF2958 domain-containing protein [Alphaproteobacteria]MBM6577141.1 DUF2958 domain-containing protein [Sphingomonas sp. BT552]MBR7710185.1 DUF2958 domain-containing protein [Microvirga sp. SRT01]
MRVVRLRGLLRPATITQLQANHREGTPKRGTKGEIDFPPVCRVYVPYTRCQWLLTELDEDGIAFGLCDLGYPELGSVSIAEIEARDLKGVRAVEDIAWRADKTLSQYAEIARREGCILA